MIRFVNKWIMRVKESRTVLNVILWGVIAVTQVLDFVRPYLNRNEMIALTGLMVFSGLGFTYLYDKLQIMKGENRQRVRRRDNFIGEQKVLNHLGFMALLTELDGVKREDMLESYRDFLNKYQKGVDITTLEGLPNEDN